MAQEGTTFYYTSKQALNFEKTYSHLTELGLSIKHPDTQIVSGIYIQDEFAELDVKKIQEMFDIKNHINIGIHLWLKNKDRIFWSLGENNVFYHNIGCCFDEYHEQIVSEASIQLALSEINKNERFLRFTLDLFGDTEDYGFEIIFEPDNNEVLTTRYFPDITFLPRERFSRVSLNDECEIIQLNQKFDCIAKDKNLSAFLKSLL